MKTYLTKSQSRQWAAFDVVGDAFGGPAYGERNDPVTAMAATAGAGLVGGIMQADAAKSAAGTQAASADRATAETQRQYDQNRADMTPWRESGVKALGQIDAGMVQGGEFNRDFTLADFNADPGLAFRMQQGRDAVEGSAARRGGLLSGGTLKALTNYGQEFGSQEYGKAYDRFNNNMTTRFNRLSSVAGNGQTATGQIGAMGTAATQSMNDTRMQSANASASGIMGGANGLVSGINSGVNGYMSMQMLNKLQPGAGGMPSYGSPTMYSGSPTGNMIA